MSAKDVVNVTAKVRAFWDDRADERHLWSVLTSYEVVDLAGVESVVGCCEILRDGVLLARSYSSRALRPPKPGAQGMNDTRDIERVQTQSIGRALGELGYAEGSSLEGDTDEPDESGEVGPAMVPRAKAKGELVAALYGDTNAAKDAWPWGDSRYVSRDELNDLLAQVKTSPPGEGEQTAKGDASGLSTATAPSDLGGRSPVPDGTLAPEEGAGQPDTAPSDGDNPARAIRDQLKGKR